MNKNKSASIEARLKNSRELLTFIKDYALYNPTSDDLKITNYEAYIDQVDAVVTSYRNSSSKLLLSQARERNIFTGIINISRKVRFEIDEIRGRETDEYAQVNTIVKLITGENIQEHTVEKTKIVKALKEGDAKPDFISVSELDRKSMLGNFRSLVSLIKSYSFYQPADNSISAASLEGLEAEATVAMTDNMSKESDNLADRSRIIHNFNGKGGLKDRARRSKVHVKRQYGASSPEYRALTLKRY
ncbi:MAG: hypothetical protein ABI528_09430 [bacterium]